MHRLALIAGLVASVTAHADKSRDTAEILSASGAAASSAVVLSSFLITDKGEPNMPLLYVGLGTSLVTPSLGEIYAGQYLTWGMGLRAAAALGTIYAFTNETESVTCLDQPNAQVKCQSLTGAGLAIVGLSAIAYIGGAWYDIADAGDAVDRKTGRMHIAPMFVPAPSGTLIPGLYFSATY